MANEWCAVGRKSAKNIAAPAASKWCTELLQWNYAAGIGMLPIGFARTNPACNQTMVHEADPRMIDHFITALKYEKYHTEATVSQRRN